MSLAEIETAARLKLKLLVLIYDDTRLRRRGAPLRAPWATTSRFVRFPDADLAAVARAGGAKAVTVGAPDLAVVDGWLADARRGRSCSTPRSTQRSVQNGSSRSVSRRLTITTRSPPCPAPRQATSPRCSTDSPPERAGRRPDPAAQRDDPGDPAAAAVRQHAGLSREEISRYDDRGPAWAWYTLTIGEHVGTHVDAPIHWVTGKDGDDVASIPARAARRPGLRGRQDGRDRGRQRGIPAHGRGPRGVGGRERRASPTAPGCCCAPAGARGPVTRPRSSTSARRARDTRARRRGLALAGHRTQHLRVRGRDASGSMPGRPAASTRRSRSTTSCWARARWPHPAGQPRPAP